jgi:hypothetical protein
MVSPVRGDHRRFQAETPLIDLFKFAEPALITGPFTGTGEGAGFVQRLPIGHHRLAVGIFKIVSNGKFLQTKGCFDRPNASAFVAVGKLDAWRNLRRVGLLARVQL